MSVQESDTSGETLPLNGCAHVGMYWNRLKREEKVVAELTEKSLYTDNEWKNAEFEKAKSTASSISTLPPTRCV